MKENIWDKIKNIGKKSPSPDQGPPPAAKEIYTGPPATPEQQAARGILGRFWDPDGHVEESEYPALLAALRSEPSAVDSAIRRFYNDEAHLAKELGSDIKLVRGLAMAKAQRYGFTDAEIEKALSS